jgi:hypothetical protein
MPETPDFEPKMLERRHANGWIATVERTPDGFFNASAHEVGVVRAQWVCQGIADVSTAQEDADAGVPTHECKCAGWSPRESDR